MTSETRTAILLDETHRKVVGERMDEIAEIAVVKDQTPIPWCTTHDSPKVVDDKARYCYEKSLAEVFTCEISTGGPDHKWWKDV